MGWIPQAGWLSYLTVDSPASALNYDLAADVSGAGRPSLTAAGLPFDPVALPSTPPPSDPWWWIGLTALVGVTAGFGLAGWRSSRIHRSA